MRTLISVSFVLAVLAASAGTSAGQTLGTFRWQLQPYCNVITVTVVQDGGQYHIDGTDDQCGAPRRASVVGLAFPNADGTIGMGLTIVTTPGGAPAHIDARVSLATIGGPWVDSAGHSGSFVLTPGAATGGAPRPLPSVLPAAIKLLNDGGLVAEGVTSTAQPFPSSGAGRKMLWHQSKSAFRAGRVSGNRWDDANIGDYSSAFGVDTLASGLYSTAFGASTAATAMLSFAAGSATTASGPYSTAFGRNTLASGDTSTAFGSGTTASGPASFALGASTNASGAASTALGRTTTAIGDESVALGESTAATGKRAVAIGNGSIAAGINSLAGGSAAQANGSESVALGLRVAAGGNGSVVLGSDAATQAAASGSFMFADRSTSASFQSSAPNEFGARFAGGFYLYTSSTLTSGAALAANGNSWASLSDVNAKENFRDVSGEEVLRKLALIPIREWNYKAQDRSIRHMGPTAQDFNAAFGLGDFPLRINTIDADGIALATINALEQRTRDLPQWAADVDRLAADNAALRAQLDAARVELAEVRQQLGDLTRHVLGRQ